MAPGEVGVVAFERVRVGASARAAPGQPCGRVCERVKRRRTSRGDEASERVCLLVHASTNS